MSRLKGVSIPDTIFDQLEIIARERKTTLSSVAAVFMAHCLAKYPENVQMFQFREIKKLNKPEKIKE